MRRSAAVAFSLLLSLAVTSLQGADDGTTWPRFRGANGLGVSASKLIPVQWTDKDIAWKVRTPGGGNSSPVIWGDRLFLHSSANDGKERYLHCLNVRDGKLLWTKSSPGKTAKTHRKNTLASSTPATDGERVYVVFWDGEALAMHAYRLDGRLEWKRDLGPWHIVPPGSHGAGNSPIVFDGRIFFANDQDETASFVCLEAKTGKLLWQAERQGFRTCYSTPFVWRRNGDDAEVVVASTAGLAGYDPESGKPNWNHPWKFPGKPLRTVASPVSADGVLLATSGDGGGDRHAIAIRVGSDRKTTLAWENAKALPYVPTALVQGEHVYAVNDLGVASCWVAKTGENVWTHRLDGNVSASPLLIDGKVHAITEEGQVHVFRAAAKFESLGTSRVGESVLASPAAAHDRLFIRGKDHLFCIGNGATKTTQAK